MGCRRTKFISIILASLMLFYSIGSFASPKVDLSTSIKQFKLVYGDVNLDGSVQTNDVAAILNYLNGETIFLAVQLVVADVNGDGYVDEEDADLICSYIAGTTTKFPVQTVSSFDMYFSNSTFPANDVQLDCGRSYSVVGTIYSDAPLLSVSAVISDAKTGEVELSNHASFDAEDGVYVYNTKNNTKNPSQSIDGGLPFAQLSPGRKVIRLFATNTGKKDVVLFSGSFIMVGGEDTFTIDDVRGRVFTGNRRLGSYEENSIVKFLNRLDQSKTGTQIVYEAIKKLGTAYADMDCSALSRHCYKTAAGVTIPRTSVEQALYCKNEGYNVSFENLMPGDLVFIRNHACDCGRYHEIHHVAVYLGNVDGTRYFVESSTSLGGVVIRVMWGNQGTNYEIDSYGRPY